MFSRDNKHNLNSYETAAALSFFMYNMDMETRHKMMRKFPEIYNKLVGQQVCRVKTNPEQTEAHGQVETDG